MYFQRVRASEYNWLNKILPKVTKLFYGYNIIVSKTDKEKIYLVSDELYSTFKKMKKRPYSLGFFFAEISDEVKFSFGVADKYEKFKKRQVVVSRFGEEKFLYKRNLMKKHIVKYTADIKEGNLVVVINQRGDALGFGKALFSCGEEFKKEGALVKNISDKGFFVKH